MGYAACLLSETGCINRLSKKHYKALIVAAYEVAFARYLNATRPNDRFSLRWRVADYAFESRRGELQLYQLEKYARRDVLNVSVNQLVEKFLLGVSKARVPVLLEWASPVVGFHFNGGKHAVYNGQLIVAIAGYRIPATKARFSVIKHPLPRQLSLSQASDMVITVLGDLISNNRELICRLSDTAEEAALLTGYSKSAASAIRKNMGVITL